MPYLILDEVIEEYLDTLEKKLFAAELDRALLIVQAQRLEPVPAVWWPEKPVAKTEIRLGGLK